MPTHTTKRYGLGPFETRLGGFTSFSGSQTEEICYGYYLPFTEGDDVWVGPYIFCCVKIGDENVNDASGTLFTGDMKWHHST